MSGHSFPTPSCPQVGFHQHFNPLGLLCAPCSPWGASLLLFSSPEILPGEKLTFKDSFLRAWALKVTDFLKSIRVFEKRNKTHPNGGPTRSQAALSPGSSMTIQGQAHS